MLKFFVFISRSKTTYISSFLTSDSCFSAAQRAKILLLALTVASLDNHLVLHARCNCQPFVFLVVWCITRQTDRNGETVKHFHNCITVLLQFRRLYCTNLRQYREAEARRCAWQCTDTKHNFRFQLLRQKIASAYNIAAVCRNSHVQENMVSSNRFTSIQGKTISRLSEFRVSFWHPKMALKTLAIALLEVTIRFTWFHGPYVRFPRTLKLVLKRCTCRLSLTFAKYISHFCKKYLNHFHRKESCCLK